MEFVITDESRGDIHCPEAYAQGKMINNHGWLDAKKYGNLVLPRKITPSDVDVVFNPGMTIFDNAGHVLCVEFSKDTAIWSRVKKGQYLCAQSLVKAGAGKIAAALAYHQTPIKERIDSRERVLSFSVMYFTPPTYACTDVFEGNERWQRFVLAWFENAEQLLSKIKQ